MVRQSPSQRRHKGSVDVFGTFCDSGSFEIRFRDLKITAITSGTGGLSKSASSSTADAIQIVTYRCTHNHSEECPQDIITMSIQFLQTVRLAYTIVNVCGLPARLYYTILYTFFPLLHFFQNMCKWKIGFHLFCERTVASV